MWATLVGYFPNENKNHVHVVGKSNIPCHETCFFLFLLAFFSPLFVLLGFLKKSTWTLDGDNNCKAMQPCIVVWNRIKQKWEVAHSPCPFVHFKVAVFWLNEGREGWLADWMVGWMVSNWRTQQNTFIFFFTSYFQFP